MRDKLLILISQVALVGATLGAPTVLAEPLTLSPAPVSDTPRPGLSPASVEARPGHTIPLEIQMEENPETLRLRQVQVQLFRQYEAKTKPLQQTLRSCLAYLDSLKNQPPSLQRISAFQAEASLDYKALKSKLAPEEQRFQSFRLMQAAVSSLDAFGDLWRNAERVKRQNPLLASQQDREERIMIAQSQAKIRTALQALNSLEKLKQDLSSE